MREIRPSGSEGGVVRKRHPYPYLSDSDLRKNIREIREIRGRAPHLVLA
jgi:hypothetical protein